MVTLTMNCPTHPRYKALKEPTADCEECRKLYSLRVELNRLVKMGRKLDRTITAADGNEYKVCGRSFMGSPVVPNMLIKAVE